MTGNILRCLRISLAGFLFAFLNLQTLVRAESHATVPPFEGFRRFVLVAGSNDGGPTRTKLLYASSDAGAFAKVMSDLGGVKERDISILRDPGRAAFLNGLEDMRHKITEAVKTSDQVELLVYYSGHSDERGFLLGEERVSYAEFRKFIDVMPARVRLAIVDACASGALTRLKGGQRLPAFGTDLSSSLSGYAFLTSSSGEESAQESDRIGASYFTHFLVTGLRGAADLNQDGKVTLAEAYQFAFNETLAETEGSQAGAQHPGYDMRLTGSGDLVLTDLRGTSAAMVLPEKMRGRVFVRSASGDLVAELQKHSGRKVELGLAPGRYEVALDKGKVLYRGSVQVDAAGSREIADKDFAVVAREQTRERGNDNPRISNEENETDQNVPIVAESGTFGAGEAKPYIRTLPMHLLLGLTHSVQNLQSSLLINRVEEKDPGFQLALGMNMSLGDARGLQMAALANDVSGAHSGVQAAAGVNVVTAEMAGAQISLIGNLVGASVDGGQIALGLNLVGGHVRGLQGSLGLNLAEGNVDFGQAAAGLNWCNGAVRGAQLAGVANHASGLTGAQIGGVNTISIGRGVQLGVVNKAESLTGVQTGVVNLAHEVHGAAFGLVNIIGNGLHNAEVSYDEKSMMHTTLVLGGPYNYTIYSLDSKGRDPGSLWGASGGLGAHLPVKPFFADLDVTSGVLFGSSNWDSLSVQSRARLMIGCKPFTHFAIFGGVSYNLENWAASHTSNLNPGKAGEDWGNDIRARTWIGYFLGVRI